jgi:hypothetical protein
MNYSDYVLVERKKGVLTGSPRDKFKAEEKVSIAQDLGGGKILVYSAFGPPQVEIANDYHIIAKMYDLEEEKKREKEMASVQNQIKAFYQSLSHKVKIDKIIFSDIATVVFFNDGEKVVVKVSEDEESSDAEKGILAACAKKLLGGYAPIAEIMKFRYFNTSWEGDVCTWTRKARE